MLIKINKDISERQNIIDFFNEKNIEIQEFDMSYEKFLVTETSQSIKDKINYVSNLKNQLESDAEIIKDSFSNNFNIQGDLEILIKLGNLYDSNIHNFNVDFSSIQITYYEKRTDHFYKYYNLKNGKFHSENKINFNGSNKDFDVLQNIFKKVLNEKTPTNEDFHDFVFKMKIYTMANYFVSYELSNLNRILNFLKQEKTANSLLKIFPKNEVKTREAVFHFLNKYICQHIVPYNTYKFNICKYFLNVDSIQFLEYELYFKVDENMDFISLKSKNNSLSLMQFANILDNSFYYKGKLVHYLLDIYTLDNLSFKQDNSINYNNTKKFIEVELMKNNMNNF